MVLSVFERKWQELPRFQQTRGVLRLLALWVSHAYHRGFKSAQKELLIELGSAPLEDPQFRSAVFEQLGESRLEGALTTDICGKRGSHAVRLDEEAVDTIKKARLHKKIATVIFFESNGGQTRNEATSPEVRLAVAGPELDLGNVETALDGLTEACYYLTTERNRYRFSLKENLNKRFADRRANVKDPDIDSRIRDEILKVFPAGEGMERIFFPDKSGQIPDRPAITLIILGPDQSLQEALEVRSQVEEMTREYGKSARTYKSALLWVVPESGGAMREEARKWIAWEDIASEELNPDEPQRKQLDINIKKARRDLTESVWRTYKNVLLLGKDNTMKTVDLGLVTSSSAESMGKLILSQLRQNGDVEKEVSPRFLTRNWPPAFTEWSTKAVRDAFYASPQFPRLLNPDTLRDTIARGVGEGHIAYVGKTPQGKYSPFFYKEPLNADDVELSDDRFIVTAEEVERIKEPPRLSQWMVSPSQAQVQPGAQQTFTVKGLDQLGGEIPPGDVEWSANGGEIGRDGVFSAGEDEGNFIVTVRAQDKAGMAGVTITKKAPPIYVPTQEIKPKSLKWTGEVPSQKWTNLYMQVLTKLVSNGELKLNLSIEAIPKDGVTEQKIEEVKAALRGLGLSDDVRGE